MALLTPVMATAASIELKSQDGVISVEGEVLSFDGETITLLTKAGEINLRANRVTCHGNDCPTTLRTTAQTPAITIATSDPQTLAIARSYLATSNASSSRRAVSGAATSDGQVGLDTAQISFVPASSATTDEISVTDVIAPETTNAIAGLQQWLHDTSPSQLLAAKALSVIAAPDTGVDRLTLTQIARILAGEIVNWAEVGGADMDLTLFLTGENTRLHEDVQALVMRPARKPITPAYVTLPSADQIQRSVKVTPGGFSVIPQDIATGAHTLGITDQCGVTTWPTNFAVRSGGYPLTLSTLVLYPFELDNTLIHSAFDKAAADDGPLRFAVPTKPEQTLLNLSEAEKVDRFVNLMSQDLSATEKEDAARLIEFLIDADQLSVSFADGDLSQTQGAWARAHFIRLRDAVKAGQFDGQEIVFVGFAPDADAADPVTTSKAAADAIMAAFTTFAPDATNREAVRFRAMGYGTLSDAACATQDDVANKVPRIEVWSHPAPLNGVAPQPH